MEHYWKNDDKNENVQNKTITQDDINVKKIYIQKNKKHNLFTFNLLTQRICVLDFLKVNISLLLNFKIWNAALSFFNLKNKKIIFDKRLNYNKRN